jgi:hypothetical protein
MAEFCDPTSAFDEVKFVLWNHLLIEGAKNSTVVGTWILSMKCHSEPENHKLLYDNGKTTLSLL